MSRRALLGGALVAAALPALYWGAGASDRYVSEAHVMIQSTDMGGPAAAGLAGMLGGGLPTEQLVLRDHLRSVDMLGKLDARLGLRGHYSDRRRDPLSRLWSADAPLERFHDHYLARVSVELDDYAGILVIRAQAYDAATAHAIATFLVDEGGRFMDGLARGLAQEQVDFLGGDIQKTREGVLRSRAALLDFQNRHGMVSPQATAEAIAGTVNRMGTQLTDLQTSRAAMLGYLMPDSANIVELDLQIGALERQMAREKARLTSVGGKTLNSTVEAYQRLEMAAQFTQDAYRAALTALEGGRIQASRTLKKMSVVQAPTLPEYALEPRRLYNSVAGALIALLVAGIAHLLGAIIRDHKD